MTDPTRWPWRAAPSDDYTLLIAYSCPIGTEQESTWLSAFHKEAEEEARRRGDASLEAEHLALALARPGGAADALLGALGVDPLDWRDGIVEVLGWREGASAQRDGRPAGRIADSLPERRFSGTLEVTLVVLHILELAEEEATANHTTVGPANLLVALLLEVNSVGAAVGRWLGLTPGRVRSAAGLRNSRRVVAEGAPAGGTPRGSTAGPMVLCGGGPDSALLADVVALSAERAEPRGPRVALVDLGWQTRPPTRDDRLYELERLRSAGAADAFDSGLTRRPDSWSTEVCESLAGADLVWFTGGNAASIYDRLWATSALEAIRGAHERGAVVGGFSAGSAVWGTGMISDFASLGDPEPFPLFGWLDHLVVFNHYAPTRERAFRARVAAFPGCRGLGIAHGGAVIVTAGSSQLCALRTGAGGVDHMLLVAPDQPLSPV